MLKTTTPESFGFGESIFSIIKVSRRGLISSDFGALVKRAGFAFADRVKKMDWREGEVPIHMYALGAAEKYGSNRNADYFYSKACDKYHNTFVKLGRFYRDHINKNKLKSYGIVKDSCFNKDAGRVELLVVLNGNKDIADENKGLVADRELEKLAAGKDISVSMSCMVPHDYCTSCNNAARSREEYCLGDDEGGHCKHGGLKHRIGRVCEDGHVLGADNRDPSWFDISHITNDNQADRIAYVTGPLFKAASNRTIGGAELSELLGVEVPEGLLEAFAPSDKQPLMKLAFELADIELQFENDPIQLYRLAQSCVPPLDDSNPVTGYFTKAARRSSIAALTDHRVPVSLSFWTSINGIPTVKVAGIAAELPGVYSRLCSSLDVASKIGADTGDEIPTRAEHCWAIKEAKDRSLSLSKAQSRILAGMPNNSKFVKQAAGDADYTKLAESFAVERLKQLAKWRNDPDFEFMARSLVAQHYLR